MNGLLKIAYKLLVNDRGKFIALLMGVATTFAAVFLMVMMTSVFAGILDKAASTVTNTGSKVWVMDPAVNNVLSAIPMPDYVLDAVRSTPGVKYAACQSTRVPASRGSRMEPINRSPCSARRQRPVRPPCA